MDRFAACVAVTLAYEGGFSDNPADPGGATNFGITKRALEGFLGFPVTVENMQALRQPAAIAVYREDYWSLLRCAELPAGVDLMVFDFGVNAGPARAARALQGWVGAVTDGEIGPRTLAAVAAVDPVRLIDGLATVRMDLLRAAPTWSTFGNGWSNRVTDVRAKARAMATA